MRPSPGETQNFVWILIIVSVLLVSLVWMGRMTADCEARGGAFVQGPFGYKCVQAVPEK